MSDYLFYQSSVTLPTIDHAKGIYAWDQQDKRYIDACSGAMVAQLGHAHPAINAAMQRQLSEVAFAYRSRSNHE